jgi:predicted DCC family thiol-disulfide oxidoreductase YuxK
LIGQGSAALFEALAGREASANIFASKNFLALEAALPPGLLPLLTDWGMSLVSFGLAAGFLVRRFFPLAIWGAIVVHCAWALLPGPFGALSYAILAPYLVFVAWPREPLVVFYDGECGFCNMTRQWISKVDFDGIYGWRPFQSGAGANYGISQEALEAKAHVVVGDRVYSGFRAFRMMTLYNPATSLAAAVLLATAGLWAPAMSDGLFAALVLLFSPLVYPAGEAAYEWVARNRYRLPPRSCKVPE